MKHFWGIPILILTLLAWSAAGATDTPVKLAIVPESPAAATAADLLTAEFSKNDQVQLLERAEIDKVYREQALSAGNRDYLKLGQILGADGLLLLEVAGDDKKQSLNTRLVAVKPGVILTAERFSVLSTELPDWSSSFSRHVAGYLPKLAVPAQDAVPISVVNLRSAVAYGEAGETERVLKTLTIERLSREPGLFVLERQRMELLSEEKGRGLDDSPFWNGSYLLEGTMDRDGYNPERMTIDVKLTPAKGGAAVELGVAGSRTNLVGLVEALAGKVTSALRVKAGGEAWNAADEAEQYFKEAQWAYRWGAYSEAQTAVESSWALGKRSKELALLSIRAYADSVGSIDEHSGNIFVPAFPDAEKLPAMTRALALFCEDSPLIFTNRAATDPDSLLDGIRIFRLAVPLSDGFYQTAELRSGHEEQLVELRRLTRQVWSILEAKAPGLMPEVAIGFRPRGLSRSTQQLYNTLEQQLTMYDLVKWEEGGVLFERPEDSVSLFRQMLDRGYIPTEQPRFAGWTADDRRRVPKVRRQFIDDLCVSTNPAIRLDGLCLALINVDFYPEGEFHVREENFLAAIWDQRAWVYSQAGHAAIMERAETILRDKYRESNVDRCFSRQPFASLREDLRRDYLTTMTKVDGEVVDTLFNNHFPTVSADEARELIPLIDRWTNQNRIVLNTAIAFRRAAGMPALSRPPSAAKPTLPAAEPLTVKFIPWTGSAFETDPSVRPQVERLMARGNELWLRVHYLTQKGGSLGFDAPSAYVAADPQTGKTRTIRFPEELGSPDPGFEVTSDSLYVSVGDHLERFRFREGKWDSIAVPMVGGAEITEFGGHLYLATADSLLKVEPDSARTTIVASSRRHPPAGEMDSRLGEGSHEFFRAGNSLGLALGNQVFVWNSVNGNWRCLAEFPLKLAQPKKYFSDQGVQFYLAGFPRRYVMALWVDANEPELLLEQAIGRGPTNRPSIKGLGQPRWEWPEPFALASSCWFAEDKNLWMLVPRAIHSRFIGAGEPVIFQDDRQATLLYFGPGLRSPLAVPIRFEKGGRPVDPFDLDLVELWRFQMPAAPFWFNAPAGFVVGCPNLMGHWLITRPDVEKRRTPLPAAVPNANDPKPQTARIERTLP